MSYKYVQIRNHSDLLWHESWCFQLFLVASYALILLRSCSNAALSKVLLNDHVSERCPMSLFCHFSYVPFYLVSFSYSVFLFTWYFVIVYDLLIFYIFVFLLPQECILLPLKRHCFVLVLAYIFNHSGHDWIHTTTLSILTVLSGFYNKSQSLIR